MKEFLDSDRVNFLVWRYLLEGNYRETAAKFQKEWHIPEPHRHFDFAPHVKSHALVSALNRGLLYYSLERDFSAQSAQPTDTVTQPQGIFGPLITQPPPFPKEEEQTTTTTTTENKPIAAVAADVIAAAVTAPAPVPSLQPTEETEISRKRQIDTKQQPLQNGSPTKKPRLSNGYDAATSGTTDATAPTPMEIDNSEIQHAYPSPMEREPASTPVPRTDGPEQGTQVDKVEELTSDTIFLELASDQVAADHSSLADSQQPGHENPIVLHCEWNPRNPSVLAAAGTDTLARIWTISRATAGSDPVTSHVNGSDKPYKDLVDEAVPQGSTVTAMAWNPEGTNIALATDSSSRGSVSIWSPEATLLLRYNVVEPPVIKLRWNPNGASILGISPENGGTMVTVFSAAASKMTSYVLPKHDLSENPLDVAWTSETDFLLCGGDLLGLYRVTENEVVPIKTFATQKDDNLVLVQYDAISRIIATASERGDVTLWDENGESRTMASQNGAVTSLAWQPLQSAPPSDERLLASGDDNGTISIWNARIPENKPKYSMKMGMPVVALSFTPDGAFIAGASPEHTLIWKVGEHAVPRASWHSPHPGWLSPKTNTDSEEEDTHCLCWDTTGQKLAYGVNSRLAVINFR